MNKTRSTRGWSLIEMMLAMIIFGMVLAGTFSGWLFVIHGERRNSTQDKLDLNVRTALENIRRSLRLTSMSKMFFYPSGPGPYTAVSFPMALDSDGDGLIELDSNTNIIWDLTKIYHRETNSAPNQFRVTTITNRDNTLTDAQRQAQLTAVAQNGTAAGTYEASYASTRALFKNLFTWDVTSDGAIFDGYNPTVDRDSDAILGSLDLSNGTHSFTFTVVGKNSSSSGYKMGLDALDASPSGSRREAEKQTISAQSGASAAAVAMTNGSWSGNYHLSFPATATGQYVTLSMENDRWEDENFAGTGNSTFDTSIAFDSTLSPMDYVVKLDGTGYTWTATEQTGDQAGNSSYYPAWGNLSTNDFVTGCAVRVLLRGNQMADGGFIKYDGTAHYVLFSAASTKLKILSAYIAQASSSNTITPDAKDAGVQLFFNGTTAGYTMDNSSATSWWVRAWPTTNFTINKEMSYLVTYLVDTNAGFGNPAYWTQPPGTESTNTYGSYVIPSSSHPDATMARATTWSGSYNSFWTNLLYGVMGLYSFYPTNGLYASAIYDTHQTTPTYQDMSWTADLPAGSAIKMKVRSANSNDMSDASAWTNASTVSSGSTINPGAKRYIQYQAELLPTANYGQTPELKNVTIRFAGTEKVVDIGGSFSKGPDYGIFEMKVDGTKLQKGITVSMTVYEDIPISGGGTQRLTSAAAIEVEPRNTGK